MFYFLFYFYFFGVVLITSQPLSQKCLQYNKTYIPAFYITKNFDFSVDCASIPLFFLSPYKYVPVCICVYLYVYICIFVCVCMCIYVYMYVYIGHFFIFIKHLCIMDSVVSFLLIIYAKGLWLCLIGSNQNHSKREKKRVALIKRHNSSKLGSLKATLEAFFKHLIDSWLRE